MIAAYRNEELIVPFTIEGACNRTILKCGLKLV